MKKLIISIILLASMACQPSLQAGIWDSMCAAAGSIASKICSSQVVKAISQSRLCQAGLVGAVVVGTIVVVNVVKRVLHDRAVKHQADERRTQAELAIQRQKEAKQRELQTAVGQVTGTANTGTNASRETLEAALTDITERRAALENVNVTAYQDLVREKATAMGKADALINGLEARLKDAITRQLDAVKTPQLAKNHAQGRIVALQEYGQALATARQQLADIAIAEKYAEIFQTRQVRIEELQRLIGVNTEALAQAEKEARELADKELAAAKLRLEENNRQEQAEREQRERQEKDTAQSRLIDAAQEEFGDINQVLELAKNLEDKDLGNLNEQLTAAQQQLAAMTFDGIENTTALVAKKQELNTALGNALAAVAAKAAVTQTATANATTTTTQPEQQGAVDPQAIHKKYDPVNFAETKDLAQLRTAVAELRQAAAIESNKKVDLQAILDEAQASLEVAEKAARLAQ